MPSPSTQLSSLRPDIGAAFGEFDIDGDYAGYIAYRALPIFNVTEQRGAFPIIPVEQLLKNAETARSNKSGYNQLDWTFTEATYATQEHGLSSPVDDRVAAIYANYFEAEIETARIVRAAVLRAAEQRVAAKLFNETTFSGQVTPITNEWDSNHTADAVPITDVKNATLAVYSRTGVWPNALIINRRTFMRLRSLDQIVDAIQSGGAGDPTKQRDITAAMLAQVFDLEMVLVAGGTKNTANEGKTATIDQTWSDEYALVAKVATTDSFGEPCIGRTLHYSADGSSPAATIETYRDEPRRADVIRVRHDVDEKILFPEVGQLLSNVTTA